MSVVGDVVRWSILHSHWVARVVWILGLSLVLTSLLWAVLGIAYLCTCCACCQPKLRISSGELFKICFMFCATVITLCMLTSPTRVMGMLGWIYWVLSLAFVPLYYVLEGASHLGMVVVTFVYDVVQWINWMISIAFGPVFSVGKLFSSSRS